MRKRDLALKHLYLQDEIDGTFIIEVSLDGYEDIFNEWDPAPFKRRDLDPDLIYFLEDCSDDIPLRYPIRIRFEMPGDLRIEEKEQRITLGIRNYFRFRKNSIQKDIDQLRKRIIIYTVMSFGFLLSATLSSGMADKNILIQTGIEGLFIGGWVFLWEAISLIFFSMRDKQVEYRKAERFRGSEYIFLNQK